MDQVKIGLFIAELRKGQEMTQRQLAERIGVSDKTISKWECGNGLPELSTIPELCSVLGINMNELLSGERLAEEVYPKKAEENMMTLMRETVEQKKKNRHSMVVMVGYLTCGIIIIGMSMCFGMFGISTLVAFLDAVSVLMVLVPVLLLLAAAGLLKSFFRAFRMLGGKQDSYTKQQKLLTKRALKLGADLFPVVGGLETVATVILLLGNMSEGKMLLANIAVSFLTFLYGVVAYCLLLPVRSKLEAVLEEEPEVL